MKTVIALLAVVYITCCRVPVSAGQPAIGDDFPGDFKERAFEHIVQLAEFGPRSAGAEGEERAFQYIRQQFEDIGFEVRVERFEYETFKIARIDFTVCGEEYEAKTLGFNPYRGRLDFGGKALFVGPDVTGNELNQMDLKDALVVTTPPVNYFGLMLHNPRLIVYVSNSDFSAIAGKNCLPCSLVVDGSIETRTSANIIAELASKSRNHREVIVSAHWDSYRDSPGADDNGSGVGVLIELARYFSDFRGEIGGTIKFVSFGGEELGIVGSRAYLNTHDSDLQNCILVFNMDQVGGPKRPALEMLGGIKGIPDRKGATQFPVRIRNRAFEGPDGLWKMVDPDMIETFRVTNRPEWLVEAIETSADQLGFEIRPAGNLGADQQTFTQAGIVATSVGTSGNQYHGPNDVPDQINKDNLEIVGKIVANVVLLAFRQ